jgi:hypothetical protein
MVGRNAQVQLMTCYRQRKLRISKHKCQFCPLLLCMRAQETAAFPFPNTTLSHSLWPPMAGVRTQFVEVEAVGVGAGHAPQEGVAILGGAKAGAHRLATPHRALQGPNAPQRIWGVGVGCRPKGTLGKHGVQACQGSAADHKRHCRYASTQAPPHPPPPRPRRQAPLPSGRLKVT